MLHNVLLRLDSLRACIHSAYLSATGVWGKGRSGLFPERHLTPVLMNIFLSASSFSPYTVICFLVKTEQDLTVKPISPSPSR